ncbi:MAG: hypothetical protein KKB59_17475, partial [Spirochaetes bacterium]|nr:hypothetical protein [Spirochaetota bacterium]
MITDALRAAVDAAYSAGTFPCAVVSARSGEEPPSFVYAACPSSDPGQGTPAVPGVPGVPGGAPESWIYDLASLSKPLATSLVAL